MNNRTIATAIVALTLASVTGCGIEDQQRQNAVNDLNEARREASIGQIAKAKNLVDQAIKADPGDARIYVGPSDEDVKANASALNWQKISDDQEDLDGFFVSAVSVFSDVGDLKTARYYAEQGVKAFPNDYRAAGQLIDIENQLGDKTAMVATANAIIPVLEAKITKGNVNAATLESLASAYWYAGNRAKALKNFNNAITTYVTDWSPGNNLAYMYAEANSTPDLPQALSLAQSALAKANKEEAEDDETAVIEDTIAWVEYRQGNYKQAYADIDQALDSLPRRPELHYHNAMIQLALGDKLGAKAELERTLVLCPDLAEAKDAIATLKDVPDQTDNDHSQLADEIGLKS